MPVAADIYYHVYEGGHNGKIPPIILLHGAGGNHLVWPSEIRRLSGYQVYALDLPGHGRSGGRGQQSILAYSRALLKWLQDMDINQGIIVGHSMGGAIALGLALDFPEHVHSLVLIGAGARLRVAPQFIESTASSTTFYNAVELISAKSFAAQTSPRLIELAANRMAETRPTVLHADFLACDAFDVTERVAQIVQPTLVVCGSEDQMTPLRSSQFLAGAIPAARLEIIPATGHMVMLENPQEVAGLLLNFLDEIL